MEVDQQGAIQTQVFQGVVEVTRVGIANGMKSVQRLCAGEALCLGPHEPTPHRVAATADHFVRVMPCGPVTLRDSFGVPHDYLTQGTAGTIWSGILNAKNANRLNSQFAEGSQAKPAGQLAMAVGENAFVGWAAPHRGHVWKNAPFLYVDVLEGDFEARVQLKTQSTGLFSAAGLMARRDDDNLVAAMSDAWAKGSHYFSTRNETANVDVDLRLAPTPEGDYALRLVRMGDLFIASGSVDGGQTWTPLTWASGASGSVDDGQTRTPLTWAGDVTGIHRPDMTGPLQVGLWYGTFSPMAGMAAFSTFTIEVTSSSRSHALKQDRYGGGCADEHSLIHVRPN